MLLTVFALVLSASLSEDGWTKSCPARSHAKAEACLGEEMLSELERALERRLDLRGFFDGRAEITIWVSGRALDAFELVRDGRRVLFAVKIGDVFIDGSARHLCGPLFARPLRGGKITSRYGLRKDPLGRGRRRHRGIDYAARPGSPVHAIGAGVVRALRRGRRSGLMIVIEHQGGYVSKYMHLGRLHPGIRVGRTVKRGEPIGTVGATGRTTGPHLHFELWHHGYPVDPLALRPPGPPVDLTTRMKLRREMKKNSR